MVSRRHYVGPPWPPYLGAYDYALGLCRTDFAWEFLRRSPAYQRDYQLNRKGIAHCQRRFDGLPCVTRVRRLARDSCTWGLFAFVNPRLPAPYAPVCWSTSPAAAVLEAIAYRPGKGASSNLCLRKLTSAGHLLLGPGTEQRVTLRDTDAALALRLYGSRATLAPINTTFLLHGLPDPSFVSATLRNLTRLLLHPNHEAHRSRDPLLMQAAIVALDAQCFDATYRDMATILYGAEDARVAWSGLSRAMKDRMRRALSKGKYLRDGGYRKLLE